MTDEPEINAAGSSLSNFETDSRSIDTTCNTKHKNDKIGKLKNYNEVTKVVYPICNKMFDVDVIMEHADMCSEARYNSPFVINEYSETVTQEEHECDNQYFQGNELSVMNVKEDVKSLIRDCLPSPIHIIFKNWLPPEMQMETEFISVCIGYYTANTLFNGRKFDRNTYRIDTGVNWL